jgi:hypothetical protein
MARQVNHHPIFEIILKNIPDYDSALMTVINGTTPEHLDMIGSEVIQRLLADKWKAFAAVSYVDLYLFKYILSENSMNDWHY